MGFGIGCSGERQLTGFRVSDLCLRLCSEVVVSGLVLGVCSAIRTALLLSRHLFQVMQSKACTTFGLGIAASVPSVIKSF